MNTHPTIRVLHIEDNPGDALLVKRRLVGLPFDVEHRQTLASAREFLQQESCDVVLLDLNLPDTRGLSTLTTFKSQFSQLPVVVLTSASTEEVMRSAVPRGAEDILAKDEINDFVLPRTLRHAVARQRLRVQLQTVVWETTDAIVVVDAVGVVCFVNPAATALFGVPEGELLGRPFGVPDSSDVQPVVILRPDGERRPAEIRATAITWEGRQAWLASIHDLGPTLRARRLLEEKRRAEEVRDMAERHLQALIDHLPVVIWTTDADLRLLWSSGDLGGLSARVGAPVRDLLGAKEGPLQAHREALAERGEVRFEFERGDTFYEGVVCQAHTGQERLIGLAHDVTEQRRLQLDLRHAQKMEAIGRLAGGIAHDFNNMMTVVIGFGEDLLHAPGLPTELQGDVQEIVNAGERATQLTQKLLAFARNQTIRPRDVDVGALVDDFGWTLQRLVGDAVELVVQSEPGVGVVRMDPAAFEQVLLNLAINARHAMPDGGVLEIATAARALGPDHPLVTSNELPPGDYVEVSVRDEGCGIAEDVLPNIFEPFFSTRSAGEGTGLGLAMCHGTIRQVGGAIAVESTLGEGTRFDILLPQVERGDTARVVLVVDDDRAVRRLMARALEGAGFEVLVAEDVASARAVYAESGSVALLVTDLFIPQMAGFDLVDVLRERDPLLDVIVVAGLREPLADRRLESDPRMRYLCKPFTPGELVRQVEDALGG